MNGECSLVIIGGGPAGLAAAAEAKNNGVDDILLLERAPALGGILKQCIHHGFGLKLFGEEMTGPQYAVKFIRQLKSLNIEYKTDSLVMEITDDKTVYYADREGYHSVKAGAVIFAMGCRERTRGNLLIPGTRPAGVMTAGTAQRYINIEGYMPGKRVVILGSGDIGLIMARRLTLEGAVVLAVVEIMETPSGLERNIVQCLEDFGIPLYLSHTVTDIKGGNRIKGITISKVDEHKKPIKGTEIEFECDTLLLSVGLIPENELSKQISVDISNITKGPVVGSNMQTSISGVFACGNVVQVHDLVDNVTLEAKQAGVGAADYIKTGGKEYKKIPVKPSNGIRYVVPQYYCPDFSGENTAFSFRVTNQFKDCNIVISKDDVAVKKIKRQRMTAGEMERIPINKQLAETLRDAKEITVSLEVL